MNDTDDDTRPLEWWEHAQLDILAGLAHMAGPDAPDIEALRADPARWRRVRRAIRAKADEQGILKAEAGPCSTR